MTIIHRQAKLMKSMTEQILEISKTQHSAVVGFKTRFVYQPWCQIIVRDREESGAKAP
ncbi:MAG: hypothetical protein ACLT8H_05190 [Streptococcus parasanguinis]